MDYPNYSTVISSAKYKMADFALVSLWQGHTVKPKGEKGNLQEMKIMLLKKTETQQMASLSFGGVVKKQFFVYKVKWMKT